MAKESWEASEPGTLSLREPELLLYESEVDLL